MQGTIQGPWDLKITVKGQVGDFHTTEAYSKSVDEHLWHLSPSQAMESKDEDVKTYLALHGLH